MAEKKITKREVINAMLADEHIKENETFVTYLQNELKLLDKKAERKGKSEEEVKEIARLKELIVVTLAGIGKGTVSEIQKANEELGDLSNQKVSSLLKQLCEEDEPKVKKATENRKTIFSLV